MKVSRRQRDTILELAGRNIPPAKIAEKTGLSIGTVYWVVKNLRLIGKLPAARRRMPTTGRLFKGASPIPVGSLVQEVRRQSPEFQQWLVEEAFDAKNIAQFAVACMVDTYRMERYPDEESVG